MSLYDDIEMEKTAPSGWASGIKLMQNQMAFKKATFASSKKDQKRNAKLPPVIDLKTRREEDESTTAVLGTALQSKTETFPIEQADPEWRFKNEYHPLWPNDYEKVLRDMKDRLDKEEKEKQKEEQEKKWKGPSTPTPERISGFSARPRDSDSDEEEDRPRKVSGSGAAIAPPPSLDEDVRSNLISSQQPSYSKFGGSSVAAKIMAKYGFKEGQGLGKSEQGIVRALEVEKTSKRGGRIVSEREDSPPPFSTASLGALADIAAICDTEDNFPAPMAPPPPPPPPPKISGTSGEKPEQKINDILKKPSKVAVLRNMVGPGEVDDELEPEVREECREKYGAVQQVLIFQIPRAPPEEAVRIFVEFQRIEAAIKAVIDLNGRYFGGRQVSAGFYDYDNFKAFKLNEPIT